MFDGPYDQNPIPLATFASSAVKIFAIGPGYAPRATGLSGRCGSAPARRCAPGWLPGFPACARTPCGLPAPPAAPGFHLSANRRCPEFAGLLALERETRCNCPAGLLWLWESGRMSAVRSRRDKGVGVVLLEASGIYRKGREVRKGA